MKCFKGPPEVCKSNRETWPCEEKTTYPGKVDTQVRCPRQPSVPTCLTAVHPGSSVDSVLGCCIAEVAVKVEPRAHFHPDGERFSRISEEIQVVPPN